MILPETTTPKGGYPRYMAMRTTPPLTIHPTMGDYFFDICHNRGYGVSQMPDRSQA